RHQEIVAVDAGIGDENVELAHGLFRPRHQRLHRLLVGEVARQLMHAAAKLAGKQRQGLAPGAGDRDGRALLMQRACDRAADAAARAGDERALAGEVEHSALLCAWMRFRSPHHYCRESNIPRAALNAATSSGVPIATPFAPSAMRLTRADSTL